MKLGCSLFFSSWLKGNSQLEEKENKAAGRKTVSEKGNKGPLAICAWWKINPI